MAVHKNHLGAFGKYECPGPIPDQLHQNLWLWSPNISDSKSFPGDYNVHPILRITNRKLNISYSMWKSHNISLSWNGFVKYTHTPYSYKALSVDCHGIFVCVCVCVSPSPFICIFLVVVNSLPFCIVIFVFILAIFQNIPFFSFFFSLKARTMTAPFHVSPLLTALVAHLIIAPLNGTLSHLPGLQFCHAPPFWLLH